MKAGRSLSVLGMAFALLLSFSVCGFADGGGDAFIEISNAAELKEFRDNVNRAGGKVINAKLVADIVLDGTEWTPIGINSNPFKGIFDGQGYSVTEMSIENPENNRAGFFGLIENAVIKNLTVSGNINTPDKSNVGMIAGMMSYSYIVGGGSRVENCVSEGTIKAKSEAGGISGYSMPNGIAYENYITNCVSNVELKTAPNNTSENNAGGIVGQSSFTIIANCVASGSLFGYGEKIGGIAGYAYNGTQIINCKANVDVEGASCVGGISGFNNHDRPTVSNIIIANCVAEGKIIGKEPTSCYVGGISGKQTNTNSTIKNCFFTGTVKGATSDVGAIVGNTWGTIVNCGWLKNGQYEAIGGYQADQGNETTGFDSITNQVCAYTVDSASLSFDREAGAANPIFRTWPGNNPAAVSEWKTSDVPGITLTQDADNNTIISATKKGIFNVGASLTLTATKFGESDVIPLRLVGDTADTSSNPLLAPALSAAVRVTSNQTINVTSIDIESVPEKLSEGSSFQLIYMVQPENADDKGITWSSDNLEVASVDQAGTITALAAGTAKITAKANDAGGVERSFSVTVEKNNIPVSSIDITNIPESLGENETWQLEYIILPDGATNKEIIWHSYSAAASIDKYGMITALAAGTTNITAEAADGSGVNKSFTITVVKNTVPVKSIKITNAPQSLKEGEAFNLFCEVLPEDATNKDLAWSSSNNKVAAVTGQSGEITALSAGETVITVEARDGSGIRDQFTLTVKKDYISNPKPERPAVKTDTAAPTVAEYYGESEIEELAKAISMDKSLLTAKDDGSVILRQDVVGGALESVKKENPGLYYESVMPVPLIKAACGLAESGRIIAFGFTVSGDNFGKADSARDIKVMKVLPDGRGVLFKAIGEESEIEDRSCALYKNGEIFSGPVMPEENYVLTLFIKDGGEFDLDGAENGSVIDPLVVLKAKEAPARESSSGGGCSAGFGGAALLALAALPVLLRGRRRG